MLGFLKENELKDDHLQSVHAAEGTNARQIYESILQLPSSSVKQKPSTKVQRRMRKPRKLPFDEKEFFLAASNNAVDELDRMDIDANNVNLTDAFGWSALMMAVYEGHLDTVKFLIRNGAEKKYADKHGNSAMTLAKKENKLEVVEYLEMLNRSEEEVICLSSDDESDTIKMHCGTCSLEYRENDTSTHKASILHRMNDKTNQKTIRGFGIPESNVGYQILKKQGWSGENGLGSEKDGILFPVKTTIRKPRSGLGTKQTTKPRVTHFKAFDHDAIRPRRPPPPSTVVKTKRQLRRDKERSQRKDRYLRRMLS